MPMLSTYLTYPPPPSSKTRRQGPCCCRGSWRSPPGPWRACPRPRPAPRRRREGPARCPSPNFLGGEGSPTIDKKERKCPVFLGPASEDLLTFRFHGPIVKRAEGLSPASKYVVPKSPQPGALSHPFFGWEGSPTKIDYRRKGYPYSNLCTGGPRNRFGYLPRMLSQLPSGFRPFFNLGSGMVPRQPQPTQKVMSFSRPLGI